MSQPQQPQQQKRRFQSCKNKCGTMITWDAQLGRTPQGGWLPMEQDVLGQIVKHECKNKPTSSSKNQQQQRADTNVGYSRGERAAGLEEGKDYQQEVLLKEVREIKARLLVILDRLSKVEKELQK